MTEHAIPSGPVARGVAPDTRRTGAPICPPGLVPFAAGSFGLAGLFWFVASFGGMTPSCAGPLDERAHYALLAALGPFSTFWGRGLPGSSAWRDEAGPALIAAAVAVPLVATAPRLSRLLPYRLLAFAFVLAWLAVGCLAGSLRIT